MKNYIKPIFTVLMILVTSLSFAQKSISINAEEVEGGIKITTTENGKSSSIVLKLADAKKYLEQFDGDFDFNIEEKEDNTYQVKYKSEDGKSETIEIDVIEMIENLSFSFESLGDDLEKMIENISSQIEYEETIDEEGNKVIKVKTVKAEN